MRQRMYNIFFVSNADHKENRTLIVLANTMEDTLTD